MRWLLLLATSLAACSGALGQKDASSAGEGGTGGAGFDASVSTGGVGFDAAMSTGGTGLDAGTPTGGIGGSFPGCTPFGGGSMPPTGACDPEGTVRNGYICYDSRAGMNWTTICCAGQWQAAYPPADAGPPTCPVALRPGH